MKLKVLALSYLFPNPDQPNYGVFVYNRLLAVQKQCELRVVAPVQWSPFRSLLAKRAPEKKPSCSAAAGLWVSHPAFPVIPRYLKWFDAFSYWWAVRPVVNRLAAEGFDFDLVDVHWTYPDILAAYQISRNSGKPFIVTIRGREALCLGEKSGRKWILDSLLKKADAVVALSSELKHLVVEIGVPKERVHVILNGVSQADFGYLDKGQAREHLGLRPDRTIILSVGSLIPRKGHHELIAILRKLQKRDVVLYIVGSCGPEGDFSARLKGMAAELAPSQVFFMEGVGHRELRYWYSAADLFCLASKGEGCPNVVLEAMSCGAPVVVTDVGAVRDIVQEGKNGFTISSPAELGEKIDAALVVAWDRQGISDAMNTMTWDACAAEVVSVYQQVLHSRPAAGSGGNS